MSEEEKEPITGFRVSTGLKDIIGRDLITDDFVAIFELVKNSFDAGARRVDVAFLKHSILIIDNGKGMSEDDIKRKWLFVAYSAKKDGTEDANLKDDYRNKIDAHPYYAGSKGIGRFSCDRLGRKLKMHTKAMSEEKVNVIGVDWTKFENSSIAEFYSISVEHNQEDCFSTDISEIQANIIADILPKTSGTILEVEDLRSEWSRDKLKALHTHLSKLISPFGGITDGFQIFIHAPIENNEDQEEKRKYEKKRASLQAGGQVIEPIAVNGSVKNFIFSSLEPRTAYLNVEIAGPQGDFIESTLCDRGKLVFKIRERNSFKNLRSSKLSCSLFYLNRRAKTVFTKTMGVSPASFGSIFLFRNGFRVFPIGEEGRDDFGLDRRKQQGYARYLGTRDLIGKIDVQGSIDDFKESSSRDQGLIKTDAYRELDQFFKDFCLKRIEKYVIGVTWRDALDKDYIDASRLETTQARARIIELLAGFSSEEDLEILDFSKDIFEILSAKAEEAGLSVEGLRMLAEKIGNADLINEVDRANERIGFLLKAEQQAREQAEAERLARQEAESKSEKLEAENKKVEKALSDEKKRNLFLISQSNLDKDAAVDLHHQITIYASSQHSIIGAEIRALQNGRIENERILASLIDIGLCNEQILAASRLATRANFRLASEEIENDLSAYFSQYALRVCSLYQRRVGINVETDGIEFIKKFKPIDVSIIIDNLVQNAEWAKSGIITFRIFTHKNVLEILVTDDGDGLDPSIIEPDSIFERGVTTTAGSGLGLHHVRSIVNAMGGSIALQESSSRGLSFLIRIIK